MPRPRRYIVPEIVQTSAMDCGPASLKCLLEGHGIRVSYGRLREACQTDIDGTSIDTIEEVAVQLGLEAEQVMVPADHLVLPEAGMLPALVVVRIPSGMTHFVVVWRRLGPFVQVMDPAQGRRWVRADRFLDELYIHTLPVPADVWRAWAGSEDFLVPFAARLRRLGLPEEAIVQLVDEAQQDAGWHAFAALDAAARMVEALVLAGGLRRGRPAGQLLRALFAGTTAENPAGIVPETYWPVQPTEPADDGSSQVSMRGAVLVRVAGRRAKVLTPEAPGNVLSPELEAALREAPARPGRDLWRLIRADGLLTPAVLIVAGLVAAAGVLVEALLFRGLFDMGHTLGLARQQWAALGVLLAFLTALLFLEWPIFTGVLRMGRHLEARLRIAFLEKIPRLGDHYFRSRPTSDMVERSHSVHHLRLLPMLGIGFLRTGFGLFLTTAGIIWIDPSAAPLALAIAGFSVAWPLLTKPVLTERDLRVQTHAGALGRFYLDALLGLVTVRTHGAEQAIRREHEGLLVEWARAGLRLQKALVGIEGIQQLGGLGLAAWLLFNHLNQGEVGTVLLLIYWALNLPVLGQELALFVQQYPTLRNTTLRLLEPLGAPETPVVSFAPRTKAPEPMGAGTSPYGVRLDLKEVRVVAGGHTILDGIDLHVAAGHHVAIVGPSGAGKSSLVGLLLGWHRASEGQVLVDGEVLDGTRLDMLRRQTAWVDPAVQLWNTSLLENLHYATDGDPALPGETLKHADLHEVLHKMPEGLQTPLGEGGRRVSGGEGQRVRFGRTLMQAGTRLVILDEPFRGLDRAQRHLLLDRARRRWDDATLLCITHDVACTQDFERVLVVEEGRLVEDGPPADLLRQPSRYRALLEQEALVRDKVWAGKGWRRLHLSDGVLTEQPVVPQNTESIHDFKSLHTNGSAFPPYLASRTAP